MKGYSLSTGNYDRFLAGATFYSYRDRDRRIFSGWYGSDKEADEWFAKSGVGNDPNVSIVRETHGVFSRTLLIKKNLETMEEQENIRWGPAVIWEGLTKNYPDDTPIRLVLVSEGRISVEVEGVDAMGVKFWQNDFNLTKRANDESPLSLALFGMYELLKKKS